MPYQNTIVRPVEAEGVGLHTAVRGHLRLVPAPADTGIVFRRTDLENFEIEADGRWLARVSYATSLMKKGVLLSTVEHVLAALYACGIDNVYIELDALEVPILDGSSRPFVEMIAKAGIRRLRRRRRYLQLVRPIEITDGDRRIAAYPAEDFRVRYFIDFPHPMVGREEVELDVDAETFSRMLAPARTFGFLDDVSRLRSMDLIRGGSLDNAIVLTRDGLMSGELRFPDEFARHKALDLIGDLALVGRPLKAFVVAHKGGHALHTALVTRLLRDRSLTQETMAERVPSVSGEVAAQPLTTSR